MLEINRDVAIKVLETVDAGLISGVGVPVPGNMCVEAAVCYALGLPHGDNPECVSPALRSLKIRLNDSTWSSNGARAHGLRRLALAQLGSKGVLDDKVFTKRVAELAIRKSVPIALRAAASMEGNLAHRDKLLAAADHCEKEGTREAALEAKIATAAATATAYATAYTAAAFATAYAAAAAAYAAYAADAYATYAAAADAAAAASAASAAAEGVALKERDRVLSEFAEGVVQILIDMKAPGCEWLDLTEAA